MSRTDLSHNSSAGLYAWEQAGSTVTMASDANVLVGNGIAFHFALNVPEIHTRGNNVPQFNSSDVAGGTLTALAAQ